MNTENPCGLLGIEFVEFVSPTPGHLDALWTAFGFSRPLQHPDKPVDLYVQNDIRVLVNRDPESFAAQFAREHGPSASAMGWRFADPVAAHAEAVRRGARPFEPAAGTPTLDVPAIYGIGDSLLYFLGPDDSHGKLFERTFRAHPEAFWSPGHGFRTIDHLTNNVRKGTMQLWADFYGLRLHGSPLLRHPRREDGPHELRAPLPGR